MFADIGVACYCLSLFVADIFCLSSFVVVSLFIAVAAAVAVVSAVAVWCLLLLCAGG